MGCYSVIKELIQEFVQNMKVAGEIYCNDISKNDMNFDFLKVEEKLGFAIHQDLKDFLNSFYIRSIEGIIFPNQIRPTQKWGSWFEFEEQNKSILLSLEGIKNEQTDIESYIEYSFNEWTGGYDFGRRMTIGSMYDSRGDILLVVNNDTGNVEWIDCEWGGFGNLDEDPNGILADSLCELINLLKDNIEYIGKMNKE